LRWSLREVSQRSSSAMAVVDGTGAALGKRLEAAWLPNGRGFDALNVDFLERRPRNSAENLKIALWQITATGGETPEVPYPKEEILDFLEFLQQLPWDHIQLSAVEEDGDPELFEGTEASCV